jgi:Mor family transcriptional regulator
MKNGKTVELSNKQLSKLLKEVEVSRVKKDIERKYDLSIMTIYNVLQNKRCSERIYQSLFKSKQSC